MPNSKLEENISKLIEMALTEDLAECGDISSNLFLSKKNTSTAVMIAREDLVLAGVTIAKDVFHKVSKKLEIEILANDGDFLLKNSPIMRISGKSIDILTAERTALNFIQRLSGIASKTKTFVDLVLDLPVKILDTRKTTPGWRYLEKYSVKCGGGKNHRFGLYDAIMLKDNHLAELKDIEKLKTKLKEVRKSHPNTKIELEADTIEQASNFLDIPEVDVIMLDNMTNTQMKKIVHAKLSSNSKKKLEASGGVNLKTVRAIAETGVDYISIGALTHSAIAKDIALDFVS